MNIEQGIVELIRKAETELPEDVKDALKKACKIEKGIAKTQIETILKNVDLAKKTKRPMCQDTGIQTFFVTVGENFPYTNKLNDFIISGVKRATKEIPLRPNTVDPFTGKNQENNLGDYSPHIYWNFSAGSDVVIISFPKGSGSENMSKLVMLNPTDGIKGVKEFVLKEVINSNGKPCPPSIIGIGIGGSADIAMYLSKIALLRPVGNRNKEKGIAKLEEDLIEEINKSGIGPMGLGGKTTVLDVHIEKAHRHPGGFPVGISIQCWADRKAKMIIHKDGSWEVK